MSALCVSLLAGLVVRAGGLGAQVPATRPAAPSLTVSGIVRNGRGQEVPDATVSCEQQGRFTRETVTDTRGRFRLTGLLPIPARVAVRYPGDLPVWTAPARELSLAELGQSPDLEFTGERGVLLKVEVMDLSGSPVAGMPTEILCDGVAGQQVLTTNDQGRFTYRTPPGHVLLMPLTRSGWLSRGDPDRFEYQAEDLLVRADRVFRFRLPVRLPTVAAVKVVDKDGWPVPHATVWARGVFGIESALADADGLALIEGVSPPRVPLFLQAPGGALAAETDVVIPEDGAPCTVTAEPTSPVPVRIVDERGRPIRDLPIRLEKIVGLHVAHRVSLQEAVSDAQGRATFWTLGESNQYLSILEPGLPPRAVVLHSLPKDPKTADRIITTGMRSLQGVVVDEEGRPVPFAQVHIARLPDAFPVDWRYHTADRDGRFLLGGLPGGALTLSAHFLPWYRDVSRMQMSRPVEVAEGARDVRLVLEASKPFTIRGRVADPDGRPIAGASVEVCALVLGERQPDGRHQVSVEREKAVVTAADGTFRTGPFGWAPAYCLVITKPGLSSHLEMVAGFGFDREFDVVLHHSASLPGVVKDETGAPVPGATVCVMKVVFGHDDSTLRSNYEALPVLQTVADTAGAFVVRSLPTGFSSVTADVTAPGHRPARVDLARESPVLSRLRPEEEAAIAGRVTDGRTGRPVAGAFVLCWGGVLHREPVVQTGPDGRYRIPCLLPGERYGVRVVAPEPPPGRPAPWICQDRYPIMLLAGQRLEGIDFTLIGGAVVSGRVIDAAGKGLPQGSVWCEVSNVRTLEAPMADDGRWVLRIPPGRFRLRIPWPAGNRCRPARRMINAAEGDIITNVDFRLILDEPAAGPPGLSVRTSY